jgi:tetratricopeptide (TPR) repeat protein
MAKQKPKAKASKPLTIVPEFTIFPFKDLRQPYFVLALIGVILYINTIYNEFALDDGIIIHKNEYVMEGVSGIDSIMSRDAYHSFYKQMNAKDQLAGGRYRPLSVVTFAIEQQFIGKYEGGKLGNGCWDRNKNLKPDPDTEDINNDGLVNDNDCLVKGCMLRHFNNMLFFVISILFIFHLLVQYLFPAKQDLAFLASLLFCVHPIHTEVVANMKSRDEILSMLFIAWTFIMVFRYVQQPNTKNALYAGILYFLALLSKEYAVTLMILVPVTLYLFVENLEYDKKKLIISYVVFGILGLFAVKFSKISGNGIFVLCLLGLFLIYRFNNLGKFNALFFALALACLTYLTIRFSIVVSKPDVPDTEILNNPYLRATPVEKWATKIFVLLKYLALLFFPHPLSSDYSFNTIEYRNFSSWDTLLSLIINIGLAIWGVKLFLKRHPMAFAFAFYFANLLMIGNVLFDIGATMGERLIYHSSLGFVIAIAWLITEYGKKLIPSVSAQKSVIIAITLVSCGLMGFKTIQRNREWKNDITLFTTDVNTVPNSVLCLGNAGARSIDLSEQPRNKPKEKELLNQAIKHLNKALKLHPGYVNGYLNLGLAYMKLGDLVKAEEVWKEAQIRYPNNPYLYTYYNFLANTYMQIGMSLGKEGKMKEAIEKMEKATTFAPNNYEIWYNLGGASHAAGEFQKSQQAFIRCLQINPNYALAQQGLAAVNQILSQTPTVNGQTSAIVK